MNTTIFVPKKINVGFQNRSDTYTKKLAYVIYYDEKNKLRKEASWNSWRDNKIEPIEYDNVPTTGFVLNKKVGDYDSGWNHRHAYTRVYDPRDFEFEITIENLLYILENTSSIKGKGLEGDFVYGWDGKDLILVPVESPDYIEIQKYSQIIHNNETIKAKDLIIGATYKTKDNNTWIYMGKFDCYDYQYRTFENGEYKWYTKSCDIPMVENKNSYYSYNRFKRMDYNYLQNNCGKEFFFLKKYKTYNNTYAESFEHLKSVNKKFINVVDDKCVDNYAELFERMEHYMYYSPIDSNRDEYIPYTLEEFAEKIKKGWSSSVYNIQKVRCDIGSVYNATDKYYFRDNDKRYEGSLEDLYNDLQPMYKNEYLANGKLYKEGK